MCKSPEYRSWSAMYTRCYNPNVKCYKHYGERGITVCNRWKHSFENFYSDIGPRPSLKHSVERINNELGYSPENCKWATHAEQMNNIRDNIRIEYKGESHTVAEWARIKNVPYLRLKKRIKSGWDIDSAIETPKKRNSYPNF